MESSEIKEDELRMDFESGIDMWVIDKEESNGLPVILDRSQKEPNVQSIALKAMDKENIKQFSGSLDMKSLRHFRIHKVSYQDISSESESDSKRKSSSDNDEYSYWSKKQRLELSQLTSHDKGVSKPMLHYSSSSSLNSVIEIRKDKESLSSGEISVMLSELEDSNDSVQEINRERLHSIENVSTLVDNKEKGGGILPSSLKVNFVCTHCKFECYSQEELKSHEVIHNIISLPLNKEQSQNHKKMLNRSNSTGSLICKTDFLDTFKNHLINQGAISVNMANRKEDAKEKVNQPSKQSKYNLKKWKCNICSYKSSDLLVYETHKILFHSEETILCCDDCDYQTNQCANLATHIRIHYQFVDCPHCNFKGPMKTSLEAHLKSDHPDIYYYTCNKCNYACKSQVKFQKHLQKHTSVSKKYQCGDCKLYFSNKQVLKNHVSTHTNVKRFRCNKCDLCFSQKYDLNTHNKKCHEQMYICDTCNSKFSQKSVLKIHMKIHANTIKPLKCEKCNSMFTRKNYLKLHMRIHVPKLTKCQFCTFQCADVNDFSKHMCINKLYNVQKRPLIFQTDLENADVVRPKNESEKNPNPVSSLPSNDIEQDNNIEQDIVQKKNIQEEPTKGCYKKKKHFKSRHKILSLRQNLPSRKNQRFVERQVELKRDAQKHGKGKPTSSGMNCEDKTVHIMKRKRGYKTNVTKNNCVIKTKVTAIIKSHFKSRKKLRKAFLSGKLNCEKVLFDKKLSPKEFFIQPVRFTSENYVECFYQSQDPSTTQDHIDRHIRQNTLLSCRFCRYKTNSDQLLQRHLAKNHSWGTALVNMLFS